MNDSDDDDDYDERYVELSYLYDFNSILPARRSPVVHHPVQSVMTSMMIMKIMIIIIMSIVLIIIVMTLPPTTVQYLPQQEQLIELNQREEGSCLAALLFNDQADHMIM